MRRATYEWLNLLYDGYDPREFGKLCQKLLAISYRRAGLIHVVERGVQGVAGPGIKRFSPSPQQFQSFLLDELPAHDHNACCSG